jgi:hypothetical protein
MSTNPEFIRIYNDNIRRDGAAEFLNDYLMKSDFFTAPASAKFHLAEAGGLSQHSVNVYRRLYALCLSEYGAEKTAEMAETIAIVGLLHDVCKVRYYKVDSKNVKVNGQWTSQPYFKVDEVLPFGHGEKSVFIIQQYFKLTAEEAMAINWHMGGFDDRVKGGSYSASDAFYKYNLCLLAHVADLTAAYLDETRSEK